MDLIYLARSVLKFRHASLVTLHPEVAMVQPLASDPKCLSCPPAVNSPAPGKLPLLSIIYCWIAVRMLSISVVRREFKASFICLAGFRATTTAEDNIAKMPIATRSSMRVNELLIVD